MTQRSAGNRLYRIFTSLTFRSYAVFVAALGLSVFLLLSILYGLYSYNYFQNMRQSIVDELDVVALIHAGQGLHGVQQYIDDQVAGAASNRFYYMLTDAHDHKLAGNLDSWPNYQEFAGGWLAFEVDMLSWDGAAVDIEFLARASELPGGYQLIAARDYAEAVHNSRLVFDTLFRAMLVTIGLGMVGGFFAAAAVLRRIDSVNEGIESIVKGDLSQRIPVADSVGNVRELIVNFNTMLDQTESLMQGVRQVSDNIAHDLRTPLTRMRNQLSQLHNSVGEGTGQVQAIIDECDDILATFNALLRIAQLEAGTRPTSFAELDLGALLQDVVELYEPLAQDKKIDIEVDIASYRFDGDRDLLFQMMVNLLDNAVKYTPAGGSISVQLASWNNGELRVSVADNGPGIPANDRENVFQRFFRLESSRSEHPGNGLGLSLVQAIVHLHRGEIRLRDNRPGVRVDLLFV